MTRLSNTPKLAIEVGYVQDRLIIRTLGTYGWKSAEIVCFGSYGAKSKIG